MLAYVSAALDARGHDNTVTRAPDMKSQPGLAFSITGEIWEAGPLPLLLDLLCVELDARVESLGQRVCLLLRLPLPPRRPSAVCGVIGARQMPASEQCKDVSEVDAPIIATTRETAILRR